LNSFIGDPAEYDPPPQKKEEHQYDFEMPVDCFEFIEKLLRKNIVTGEPD